MGMGMAMAPATDAIMGSLPLEKASVGSAVNDATRITGGALGVAILGSVLASGYRGGMEDAVAGMPAPAADAARESLAGGLAVASQAGGETGQRVLTAAQDAFLVGHAHGRDRRRDRRARRLGRRAGLLPARGRGRGRADAPVAERELVLA